MTEVYLDGDVLEFKGERTRVTGLAREALVELLKPPPASTPVEPSEVGGYRLVSARRALIEVSTGQVVMKVTKTEARILEALIAARESVVTIAKIEEAMYGSEDVPLGRVLNVLVHHLRQRMRHDAVRLELFNVWGIGYGLRPLALDEGLHVGRFVRAAELRAS